jgi:hypothetical protein
MRYYSGICLQELRKTTKSSIRVASVSRFRTAAKLMDFTNYIHKRLNLYH